MPRLVVSLLFLAALAALLCGPVLAVALRLRRRGDRGALRPLRAVWLAQLLAAGGLTAAADLAALPDLRRWLAAILLGVSLAGAGAFWAWRRMLGWLGRFRRPS
jgi:drug/metabolite transporter (DMT)-like permease